MKLPEENQLFPQKNQLVNREISLEIGRQGHCLENRESPCQKGRVDSSVLLALLGNCSPELRSKSPEMMSFYTCLKSDVSLQLHMTNKPRASTAFDIVSRPVKAETQTSSENGNKRILMKVCKRTVTSRCQQRI